MYEAFYGLNEKPFNLTPDPRFLFLSSKHKEAFAHLLYGIRNRTGFVMVSGEIGTGKTTICRSLLKQLDPDTEVAFIFNPKLTPTELLKTINADFGIDSRADTIRGLIDELNSHLLDRAGKGKNCVLIIDEAQNLGTETLEQIRLLSNLETETEKLLQIVLIGQPELAEKLALDELRQLNQRIAARYHLGTLSREETLHYIAFRLRVAGGQKKVRFTRRAVRLIHRISRGTPRIINAVCDRALLIGYTKELRTIAGAHVRKAAREIQGSRPPRRRAAPLRLLPASMLLTTAAAAVVAALFVRGDIAFPTRAGAENLRATPDYVAPDPANRATNSPGLSPLTMPASQPESESPRGVAEAASLPGARPATDIGDLPVASLDKVARVPGGASAGGMPVVETSPTVHRGLDQIVRAWNSKVVETPPVTITPDSVARFAAKNNLLSLDDDFSLDQLLAVGLPALLRVSRDEWSALVRVEDGQARLIDRDGTARRVTLAALRGEYSDRAIYLWRDPDPAAGILGASARGKPVERLQQDLVQLGLLPGKPTGRYDPATIDAVTRIQRTAGLIPDGVAGPQTRMVLASWLGRPGTPRLAEQGFTDRLRERVLESPGMVATRSPSPPETEPSPAPQRVDVLEPELESFNSPEPETGGPDPARDASPEPETYTPQLPGAPSGGSPSVTPAATPVVPIRPSSDRESFER
jgi:general secretion pathway protein A